ncbi:hypothetical protein HNP73_000987 [Amaricoccus macauensis]|uniref:Uncharacterized protein n=1 Tax=Amaricoccus macauensis TaxID=57001 RepID=A0A840SMH0_9RHOB|nr:DUF6361 family protein [Amaricoccus macauensis]MBB5221066.1 hypothetical protein [Amaricoccus macauensis]
MSYLAWIDFDPEERRRAQTLIDLFKPPEARDELGLSTIRDGLADLLFPGTSTIQTRLRYMLFIPWIYREAQQRKASQAERTIIARDLEVKLSAALLNGKESEHVIGRRAGESLKRLASSVYWAGMHTLGIRTLAGNQATFLSYGPESLKDHDLRLWSTGLPNAPENLFEQTNFRLLPEEVDFLRDRIAGSAKASLLNELAAKQKNFSEDWAWQVREDTVSDRNRSILRHAERFSGVMHGASLLYNLLLALRAAERPNAKTHGEASALIEDYRQLLEDWRGDLQHLALQSWDLDDLFQIVGSTSHNLTQSSREFVRGWLVIALQSSKSLETDHEAIDLLRKREQSLKRMKARLLHDAPLERWSGASGLARLDFRWGIARRYLGELVDVG